MRRQRFRYEMARGLLTIQVRAWRAARYQPPEWAEGESWFENFGWSNLPVRAQISQLPNERLLCSPRHHGRARASDCYRDARNYLRLVAAGWVA